jgi:hypothetical protein
MGFQVAAVVTAVAALVPVLVAAVLALRMEPPVKEPHAAADQCTPPG